MLQDPKNFLVLRNEFSSLTGTGEGASILMVMLMVAFDSA